MFRLSPMPDGRVCLWRFGLNDALAVPVLFRFFELVPAMAFWLLPSCNPRCITYLCAWVSCLYIGNTKIINPRGLRSLFYFCIARILCTSIVNLRLLLAAEKVADFMEKCRFQASILMEKCINGV